MLTSCIGKKEKNNIEVAETVVEISGLEKL